MISQKGKFLSKFRPLKSFDSQLKYSKEMVVDENEIVAELFDRAKNDRFLGMLSKPEVLRALENHEIFSALRLKGFVDTICQMETSDPFEHRLQIYLNRTNKESMLIEMVLHKTRLFSDKLPIQCEFFNSLELLFVEWLLLQNPAEKFDADQMRLPGQRHPGLGLAKKVLNFLIFLSKKLRVNGIVAVPGHFHNAVIFSRQFQYLNPESEGKLKALQRDLKPYTLNVASWAIELNCVRNISTGDYVKWFVDWQVLSITDALNSYFSLKEYSKKVEKTFCENKFVLDEEKFASQEYKISELANVVI
jgi:hypothetical protein